jgi:protein FRA10AC1
MSWKQAGGKLVSGPPTASGSSNSNDRRFKQNTGGLNAFQREQQFAAHYGRRDSIVEERGRTDWDVLKENHRFIRDGEDSGDVSWEERLARAYESKLFKEFALVSPPFTALGFGSSFPPALVCCPSGVQWYRNLAG